MARKYSRDKIGRFAGSGGGATARGSRLTGKGPQGRRGGNLDAGDTGQKSSVPKGTVGATRKAQDRNRADRTGASLKKATASGAAQRSAATRASKKNPTALTKVNFRKGRIFK
jgi:hypothetical protein